MNVFLGDITDAAGEHTAPSTDLHGGAGAGAGSHLDTGRLLVVTPLRLILQPDRALAPPGWVKLPPRIVFLPSVRHQLGIGDKAKQAK